MQKRPWAMLALIAISAITSHDRCSADTLIYLVRHAEKTAGDDPGLTEAGKRRANDLARTLRSANIDMCYATEFKRTRETAEPTAKLAKVPLKSHPAGQEKELADIIRREFQDKSLLIAAHSNTIPTILRHFGDSSAPQIVEEDYDNLFIIQVNESGKSKTLRLHYGAENPAVAP